MKRLVIYVHGKLEMIGHNLQEETNIISVSSYADGWRPCTKVFGITTE